MTTERHASAFSRHDMPEECITHVPLKIEEGAGKAGYRLTPMARVHQKKHAAVTTGSAGYPAFPARWFYGL